MRFSFSSFAFALALGASVFIAPQRAFAQTTSDSDRAAARELYFAGVALQDAGKFGDALDKFSRANQVITAPTNLLHMAECEAMLGRLVESMEHYRGAIRLNLPTSPAAFKAAAEQAAQEVKGVESRVPELKIDVTPANVPTLTVTIDDQPLNSALVGVARPINPGSHRVAASAPGYSRAEQTIDVKERGKQTITLTLQSTGGVVYGPAGGNGVTVQGLPQGPPTGQPTTQPGVETTPTERPPVYKAPKDIRSQSSLLLGLRFGGYVPVGEIPNDEVVGGQNRKLGDISGVGIGGGIEGHFRFARTFAFGLLLEGAKFGAKPLAGTSNETTSTTGLVMGTVGWISNPDGLGFWPELGVGYRVYNATVATSDSAATNIDISKGGLEFMLGAGVHIRAGSHARIVPKVEIDFGGFSKSVATASDVGAQHVFAFLGIGGYFDIDLDKHPLEPPADMPKTKL
jgi:hypothetical protein